MGEPRTDYRADGTLSDEQSQIDRNLADTILALERTNGVIPSGLVSMDRLVNQIGQAKQQRMWMDMAIERGELMRKRLVAEALRKSTV